MKTYGEWRYSFTHSWPRRYMDVSGHLHPPDALFPVPSGEEAGWVTAAPLFWNPKFHRIHKRNPLLYIFPRQLNPVHIFTHYEGVSKSVRIGRLEEELQMEQLSATRCSCIAILWVNLVRFAAINLCVASQRVFIIIVVYFVIDSVRKLLDIPSYLSKLRFNIIFPCPPTTRDVYLQWRI
jgi:hypothetical protein